ncbi:MAG: Rha family transcriptional regulator [Tetragenococcus halophilus]|nr:Rha family transcriptional regulator [Tetragenococcus halophilus]
MQIKSRPKINIIINNEEPVTSSRNVAENFERNHRDVLKAIDTVKKDMGVAQNYADLFHETFYTHEQNKQQYREVLMTKDGFALLAMGFTGKKAIQFKLAYIEQFNKMEHQIKQQLDTSQLSPELQMFNKMFNSLAQQEIEMKKTAKKQEQLETKVDGIKDLLSMDAKNWRTEVNNIIKKIAVRQGGFDKFKEIANESYIKLENKAHCKLDIRLENRRKNMIAQGMGKTTVKRLNKLDIISEDHRLKEIYVSVVKMMAIKYGLWEG